MSQTAATPEGRRIPNWWILSTWLDLVFFVGTPLLILPVLMAAGSRWTGEDVFLIVSTFGALGHHAPGLMRAYGDRQLFRRFRIRFTLVPIIALTVFMYYSVEELPGAMLVLLLWGVWHFLMQTYGFARIYDSKVRCFDATTRRLDFAVCVAWSGLCLLSAPNRIKEFLSLALNSGLSMVRDLPFDQIRTVWTIGTAVITALFVGNVLRKMIRGEPTSPAKLALLVGTFTFFWICSVSLTNFLLGVAMFELFHDVQYLAIVWLFNRNRVDRDPEAGAFTKFVFRRSGGLVGVYVGLVVAYGFIGFAAERLTSATLQQTLFGVIAASNLLHYYYDGFIWKIREPETSKALGVASETAGSLTLPRGLTHVLKWGVLLVIVGLFVKAQQASEMTPLERAQILVDCVPDAVTAQNDLAKALIDDGRHADAVRACRAAEQVGPGDYRTHMYLGIALTGIGQPRAGTAALQKAFELQPNDGFLRFHLAMADFRQQRYSQALGHLKASVALRPQDAVGHYNLGILHQMLNQTDNAIRSLQRAIEIRPAYPAAHRSLGEAYAVAGDRTQAVECLKESLRLDAQDPATHESMANILRAEGRVSEANEFLKSAVQLLAEIAPTDQRAGDGARLADLLLEHTRREDSGSLALAARCYAAVNRLTDAAAAATEGRRIALQRGETDLADSLQLLAAQYAQQLEFNGNR
ncbi:MAG: tetratricopeptide repeat protein [Fuerstiella sp.]